MAPHELPAALLDLPRRSDDPRRAEELDELPVFFDLYG
jgi:hypothetical protein